VKTKEKPASHEIFSGSQQKKLKQNNQRTISNAAIAHQMVKYQKQVRRHISYISFNKYCFRPQFWSGKIAA